MQYENTEMSKWLHPASIW